METPIGTPREGMGTAMGCGTDGVGTPKGNRGWGHLWGVGTHGVGTPIGPSGEGMGASMGRGDTHRDPEMGTSMGCGDPRGGDTHRDPKRGDGDIYGAQGPIGW